MKALVVGFGSIGKRHTRNLLDHSAISSVTVKTSIPSTKIEFTPHKNLSFTSEWSDQKFDFAIICNQTSKHIEAATFLAQKNIPILLEKPVCPQSTQAQDLLKTVQKQNLPVLVAYNLRFLPAIQTVKSWLAEKKIGEIQSAHFEVGQFLPDWRPGTDYRTGYSAKKELGGGVALDLSHEVDLMLTLLGEPLDWKTQKSNQSDLEIETEDTFEGHYRYPNFQCFVHLDYIKKNKERFFTIKGSKGDIHCDLIGKSLTMTGDNPEEIKDDKAFDTNQSYKTELDHFIDVIQNQKPVLIPLEEGLTVLRLLEN